MITVFKNRKIINRMVLINDAFFNKYTVDMLDEHAKGIVSAIDGAKLVNKYKMKSRFDGTLLSTDKLSTGCKTVLNIFYNPKIVFDIRECGDNALDLIYSLDEGKVYCEYPMISFDMKSVRVADINGKRVISDYSELKEWWSNDRS